MDQETANSSLGTVLDLGKVKEHDLKPAGLDWITCLRAPAIQTLAQDDGPLQMSLFDETWPKSAPPTCFQASG